MYSGWSTNVEWDMFHLTTHTALLLLCDSKTCILILKCGLESWRFSNFWRPFLLWRVAVGTKVTYLPRGTSSWRQGWRRWSWLIVLTYHETKHAPMNKLGPKQSRNQQLFASPLSLSTFSGRRRSRSSWWFVYSQTLAGHYSTFGILAGRE